MIKRIQYLKPLEGVETEQIMIFENQEYMEWNSDQLILRMHDGPHSYTFED